VIRTRKWGNRWGIPGGKIDRGESSINALRREIREETRIELDEIHFIFVQDCIDSPEFTRPEHFLLLNYVARARSTNVKLNHEAEDFLWLSTQEALSLDLNQPTRRLLVDALEKNLIPNVRA
jgi:phosphoglycolate phosphatase